MRTQEEVGASKTDKTGKGLEFYFMYYRRT